MTDRQLTPSPSPDSESESATKQALSILSASLWPGWQPATAVELKAVHDLAAFVVIAKYPVRPYSVLTPDQLAAARAQLGSGAFVIAGRPNRSREDRRPLTAEELRRTRAMAGTP